MRWQLEQKLMQQMLEVELVLVQLLILVLDQTK
jgi:hypothetical protein